MKILKSLMDSQLMPSEIAQAVGVNYMIVEQHLEILEAEGILSHAKFGKRIRYYKFSETLKAKAVRDVIEIFQNGTHSTLTT